MNRKRGLNIERHQEIGLELARIQDRLTTLGAEICNAYPVNSPVYRLAANSPSSRAFRGILSLRSELENLMIAEYRGDPRATARVYFPLQEARWPADRPSALKPNPFP